LFATPSEPGKYEYEGKPIRVTQQTKPLPPDPRHQNSEKDKKISSSTIEKD
jgi:hypothetical protein